MAQPLRSVFQMFLIFLYHPSSTHKNRAKNMAIKLGDVLNLLVLKNMFGGFLWFYNCSKMVNLGFRMDCNTFWNIFATSQKWTNLDPIPLIYYRNISKHIRTYGNISETYYWCTSGNRKWKLFNTYVLSFWNEQQNKNKSKHKTIK